MTASVAYREFLTSKRFTPPASGLTVSVSDVHRDLFEFQRHIVAWCVQRGRSALWADTGLGKTRMQLEWLRLTGERGIILAPLGVTEQTIREGAGLDDPIEVAYCHDQSEVDALEPHVHVITNYERLDRFDAAKFNAVVLDESSILKAYSGTIKRQLVAAFDSTPYRLACTATPAPNDLEELCNHADFLGIMSPAEMRSTFFIADSRGEFMKYRIKGHAKDAFYEWLASWAIACRNPGDLGFDDDAHRYELPDLTIHDHLIETDWKPDGQLLAVGLKGITERAQVRKATLQARVDHAAKLVLAEPSEQWIVWCGRNDEADAMAEALSELCPINVQGSDTPEVKAQVLREFAFGNLQVLVTKPSIAGYGLNLQGCSRMVFVGLSDSYESYYQSIRRCYRFGQQRPVDVHIVVADVETAIIANVRAKEAQAREISGGLIAAISSENRGQLFSGTSKGDNYEPNEIASVPTFLRSAV